MSDTRQAVTRLTLDLSLPEVQKSVSVTKGDVNRRLEITLTDGSRPFPLPATWSAVLVGVKPDGSTLFNSCVVDRGRILYDFAAGREIATCAGRFSVAFVVYDQAGDPVYSPELFLHVVEDETVELISASEETALHDMIRRLDSMGQEVEACEAAVERMDETIRTSLKGDKGDTGAAGEPGPQGPQGVQGERGEPFTMAMVYTSVAEMNVGYATDGVPEGQFVVIETGNPEDEENARLYIKGKSAYEFITDLSGARGMQGPQGVQGLQGIGGKSAYQYALEGGFSGTEAEFMALLSVVGDVRSSSVAPNANAERIKSVPEASAPYATLRTLGGMTFKVDTELRNAAVTAVESVGENLHYTLPISAAVRNLEGYGWGIDSKYNNHIKFEDDGRVTFHRAVKKIVLKGTENWELAKHDTYADRNYFTLKLGNHGTVVAEKLVCNLYRQTGISGNTEAVGVNTINSTAYNRAQVNVRPEGVTDLTVSKWKSQLATWNTEGNPLTVYYALSSAEIADISDMFPVSHILPVKVGGTVTMVNEYGLDVPNEIVFYAKANKIIGADTFVGSLKGQATHALRDGEGNVISDTYVSKAQLEERLAALAASLTGSAEG